MLMSLGHDHKAIKEFADSLLKSQWPSIDAFLEKRSAFMGIGKAAIAYEIRKHERPLEFLKTRENWYRHLLDMMDASFDELGNNKLAIVTFNYDRSLEAYLTTTLSERFGRSLSDCARVLSAIPVVHVHGALGPLHQSDGSVGLKYGDGVTDHKVLAEMARSIIVIHEGTDDSPELARAHELMGQAQRIYCLGFGYGATNMRRLKLRDYAGTPGKVKGSFKELTGPEKRRIEGAGVFKLQLVQCRDCFDFTRELDWD